MTTRFLPIILCICLLSIHTKAQKIGDPYPNARDILSQGLSYLNEGKYVDAVQRFSKIHENDSFYYEAQYNLALAYRADEQYEPARIAILNALNNCNGMDYEALIEYGNILDLMGRTDSAIKVYDYGFAKYPLQYRYLFEKGAAYGMKKQWDSAIKYYSAAIRINPYHMINHYRLGIMAANANRPTLALLALNMYCIMSDNEDNVLTVVKTMESIANNEYNPDTNAIPDSYFAFADAYKDIDLIVHSKAALDKKYKNLTKLEFNIVKQLQVICEKLPDDPQSTEWIMLFYHNLYKQAWDKKIFEGMVLQSLSAVQSKEIQSQLKSKNKVVKQFQDVATTYFNQYRDYRTTMVNGKEQKSRIWFVDGYFRAIGEEDAGGNPIGEWTYYHQSGYISAIGQFEGGKKTGEWKYYYENGILKSIEEYKNGVNDGKYTKFHPNSVLAQTSVFKNDQYEGEVITYNGNGTISSKMTFSGGKLNGVKYDYDVNGLPDYAGEIKNGSYEGWYKSYHSNGSVNMDTRTLKDELHGDATFYYEDGKVKLKGKYESGERVGDWTWYYQNGQIETKGNYVAGKENGKWLYYHDDGKIEREENYENGAKKGILKYYDRQGILYAELTLKNSAIDSYKYFDKAGKIISEGKTQGGKLNYVSYSEFRNKIREGQLVNGKEQGIWKYYYENGALKYEMPFKDGKEEGKMTYYYQNGKIDYFAYFRDGERDGFYQSYHMNGKLQSEGYYRNGDRYGPWDHYYPNGKLETREFYINGKITGKDYEYNVDGTADGYSLYKYGFFNNYYQSDTNGKIYHVSNLDLGYGNYKLYTISKDLMLDATYKAGLRDSISVAYYGKDKIRSVQTNRFGKRNGPYKAYFDTGKLKSEGMYKNGEQEGEWKYYSEDGYVFKTSTFKEGEYHGPFGTFHSNGKKEIICTYYNGLIQGTYYMYDREGVLMYQAEYDGGVLISYTYLGADQKLVPSIPVKNETVEIKAFYPNGKPSISYTIEKGLIQGTYTEYYQSGQVYVQAEFKDGNYDGTYKVYYPNGNLKRHETHFYDDEIGVSKFYHENGKISKEIPYVFGDRHGVAKFYDNTGKLIKKTVYYYDYILE